MLHISVILPDSCRACRSTDHLLLPFLARKGLRPNVEGAEPGSQLIPSGVSFPISFSELCSLAVSFPSRRIVELNWSSMKLWRRSLSHFCTFFPCPYRPFVHFYQGGRISQEMYFCFGISSFLVFTLYGAISILQQDSKAQEGVANGGIGDHPGKDFLDGNPILKL